MDSSGNGKSPNTSLSFRYNANNEELEELFDVCEDDQLSPQLETIQSEVPSAHSEASPKRGDKAPSILDKYFKSIRTTDKLISEKEKEEKESKPSDESRTPPKEISSSPMKEYLNRFGKKNVSGSPEGKDVGSETWKLFHDFKFKIARAVEDMKTHSVEEPKEKEKSVLRDSSVSDSEENSVIKDSDLSMGDTDNQVSSLESSLQNLSEYTQPLTAKATDRESSLPCEKNWSECSDDTQRNLGTSETAPLTKQILYDSIMDIESGVEALEDNIDGFSDIPEANGNSPDQGETSSNKYPLLALNKPQSQTILEKKEEVSLRTHFLTFSVYFLTFLVFINWYLFPDFNLWNGFLLGLWVCFMASKVHQYVMEVLFGEEPARQIQLKSNSSIPIYTIPSVKEHRPLKKYEGWVNHYRYPEYDPCTYNLSKTVSAFMKLEGCNLRISYTKVKIPKRQLWDEKIEKVPFYQHRLYDLTGARIILLPKGLVKRRLWSKKYPICVILRENHQIHVLEKENVSGESKKGTELDKKKEPHDIEAETNTSPEKKKKFMWRRRDKSPATPDLEPGKEGLRHRFVSRRKHKDKKSDTTTSGAVTPEPPATEKDPAQKTEDLPMLDAEQDPPKSKDKDKTEIDVEEDIDEKELSRFKDFLEDPELEGAVDLTSEGEWSVHTQEQRQPRLFIFTRTGRDKHEWYRRISTAISEANPKTSSETSTSDDKSVSESQQMKEESKESIDTAVYKVTDKDTVAFAKQTTTSQGKTEPLLPEGPVPASPPAPPTPSPDSYEKAFWPYLQKIIETTTSEVDISQQCHAVSSVTKPEVGVMCELESTPPRKHSKIKKKIKRAKPENAKCECRVLPAEVTWLNTLIARAVFDIARNPAVIASLQDRIQRKLGTLKLPSFMSPLVVTELSVLGASPLVERVYPVAWDERGLWLDADLRYDGGAYITVLTQINLMKLKEKNATLEEQLLGGQFLEENSFTDGQELVTTESVTKRTKRAVYDSDVEDSAESSDEEEEPPHAQSDTVILPSTDTVPSDASPTAGSSKKKFLRMVDKIATNKYFQQVTDYKYVKRAMEGLSNTDIKLQLEIQGLEGRLAFNLPPPPHDRVWLGFRTNPQLVLKARPAVGQRTLRFAHITNWIEQKLSKEFEKVLVLPNMEDFVISMLAPTPIQFE